MLEPRAPTADGIGDLYAALLQRGVSRRAFLRFCAASTAALALPSTYVPRVARALQSAPRVPIVWVRGLSCGGDSGALLRADQPSVAEVILDLVSVSYAEPLMAAAGDVAESAKTGLSRSAPNGYFAVVEGAVPSDDQASACTIAGRALRDVVADVARAARLTIAVGTCATDGGLAAASGGTTGASGIRNLVPSGRLVSLPGCPVNPANLTAVIVHSLTFEAPPATDPEGRPLFAYGALVHNLCERRAHFEFGEFVQAWGDEAAQKGWCLYKMGCKGPETFANCPTARFGGGASWPVQAGQVCIGCTMPGFWDVMTPFHERLPAFVPFAPTVTADQAGAVLLGGVLAATGVHGAASYVRARVSHGAAAVRASLEVPEVEVPEVAEPVVVESPTTEALVEVEPQVEIVETPGFAAEPHVEVPPEAGAPAEAEARPEPEGEPQAAAQPEALSPPPDAEADKP